MKLTPSPQSTLEDRMICEATEHIRFTTVAMRKGCQHALLAGMRLIWLHANTAQNPNGYRVSRDTREGFDAALEKIGLARRTAYRWMTAAVGAAYELQGLSPQDFPEPTDDSWEELERLIGEKAAQMSLRRLVIGHEKPNSEDQRQSDLITRAENGDTVADGVLDRIARGELTLVQAIRAAAGALATLGKERKDPQYLTMDGRTGELGGLFPKSCVTLKNAFDHWEALPGAARHKARDLWLELVTNLPIELR